MDNNQFLDLINILSLVIGFQNLQENREQSAHNDIHAENAKQTEYLLLELTKHFQYQNTLLEQILQKLEIICNEQR